MVGGNALQTVAKLGAPRFILRFEIPLVLDGLRLNAFERHLATLRIVTVELGVRCLAFVNERQLRRQIDRIVNAAIHSHAT